MTLTPSGAHTILLVEDYEDSLILLTTFLRLEGYGILTAMTGEDAVDVAVQRRPDLILMDIGLPGMDGLSAVWQIREHPELVETPVVIISAHDALDLREEAVGAGCKGYLVKPLDMPELKQVVKNILRP